MNIYRLNGVKFKELGVYVKKSDNLESLPTFKEPRRAEWGDMHGAMYDLGKRYAEPKSISLECFAYAKTEAEFYDNMGRLLNNVLSHGWHRLEVTTPSLRVLAFDLFLQGIDHGKTTEQADGQRVKEFKLDFVEAEPIKTTLKVEVEQGTRVELSIEQDELVQVTWGDGLIYQNPTDVRAFEHSYDKEGTYYINITTEQEVTIKYI